MSNAGSFRLNINNGKQDKLLTATELLKKRIQLLVIRRKQMGLISLPTLTELEASHVLLVNNSFKPFVTMVSEYSKTSTRRNPELGEEVSFDIPDFGDFIGDMVVRVQFHYVDRTTGNETTSLVQNNRYMTRWCSFPGERLFEKIKLQVNGNTIDEYSPFSVKVYREFHLPESKKNAWYKNVGQEIPQKANMYLSKVQESDNTPYHGKSIYQDNSHNTKFSTFICNGLQTPKENHKPPVLWIPLLFWFNCRLEQSIPITSLSYGQRYINIKLCTENKLFRVESTETQSVYSSLTIDEDYRSGLDKSLTNELRIKSMELYTNCLFIEPLIYEIYIKRIGFQLIRVHKENVYTTYTKSDSMPISGLKYPMECLYFGMQIEDYSNNSNIKVARYLDRWERFDNYEETYDFLGGYMHEIEHTVTYNQLYANVYIDTSENHFADVRLLKPDNTNYNDGDKIKLVDATGTKHSMTLQAFHYQQNDTSLGTYYPFTGLPGSIIPFTTGGKSGNNLMYLSRPYSEISDIVSVETGLIVGKGFPVIDDSYDDGQGSNSQRTYSNTNMTILPYFWMRGLTHQDKVPVSFGNNTTHVIQWNAHHGEWEFSDNIPWNYGEYFITPLFLAASHSASNLTLNSHYGSSGQLIGWIRAYAGGNWHSFEWIFCDENPTGFQPLETTPYIDNLSKTTNLQITAGNWIEQYRKVSISVGGVAVVPHAIRFGVHHYRTGLLADYPTNDVINTLYESDTAAAPINSAKGYVTIDNSSGALVTKMYIIPSDLGVDDFTKVKFVNINESTDLYGPLEVRKGPQSIHSHNSFSSREYKGLNHFTNDARTWETKQFQSMPTGLYQIYVPNSTAQTVRYAPFNNKTYRPKKLLKKIGVSAHGVKLMNNKDYKFYNAYLPYMYGNINSSNDVGIYMINFALNLGDYQPSGYLNMSRVREFYIDYEANNPIGQYVSNNQYIRTPTSTDKGIADMRKFGGKLFVLARAINFLMLSDNFFSLKYST